LAKKIVGGIGETSMEALLELGQNTYTWMEARTTRKWELGGGRKCDE